MKNVFYFFCFFALIISCKSDPSGQGGEAGESATIEQENVFLTCVAVDGDSDDGSAPLNEVFLQLSESKVKVADILSCETLTPDLYEQYQIPAEAISAVGGWWAGAGDYIYVIKEGDAYAVMHGEMYEEKEDNDYGYKSIARFNKKGERVAGSKEPAKTEE